jgi:hypothetical protein
LNEAILSNPSAGKKKDFIYSSSYDGSFSVFFYAYASRSYDAYAFYHKAYFSAFISFKIKFPIDEPHHMFQMRDLTQRLDTLINLLDHIRITNQLSGGLIPFDGVSFVALLLMDFGK